MYILRERFLINVIFLLLCIFLVKTFSEIFMEDAKNRGYARNVYTICEGDAYLA